MTNSQKADEPRNSESMLKSFASISPLCFGRHAAEVRSSPATAPTASTFHAPPTLPQKQVPEAGAGTGTVTATDTGTCTGASADASKRIATPTRALPYRALQCTTLHHATLPYPTLHYTTLHSTTRFSTQINAVHIKQTTPHRSNVPTPHMVILLQANQ